ncbi:hypothetical protein GQF42_23545 [Streptomyces broussonetiae]|uniref:Uncharacterized protein n=2 Tax=Streptomyces broussonetiae TaxID=2686304 RepID=A0A6I6N361_9ACTN|nr:hypothetical protein [Streptomyces broussonetiae]QHA05864.1 hypothetical protein GQF42_23545 [Streptomyces broussonetiae]
MDYCSSCRRHLNGALVCPGCGAYAPDIAPPGTDGHAAAAAPATLSHLPATALHTGADTWYDDAPFTAQGADAADATDVTDAPRAPQGRAARRRQLARWKKSQRRAVVATAVALVGGGLTFASLDRGSGDRAQAATAPDNRSMGLGEEQPASPDAPATPAPSAPSAAPHHASRTPGTPTARTPVGHVAANAPRQQSFATTPRTAAPAARPDSIPTTPRPTASTAAPAPAAPAPATSTSASGTGTTANPAPSTGSSTGTSGSTGSGQTSSTPSSGQLCLVLVCLG